MFFLRIKTNIEWLRSMEQIFSDGKETWLFDLWTLSDQELQKGTGSSHLYIAHRSVCNRDQESWSLWLLDRSLLKLLIARVQRTKTCHTSLVVEKMRWSVGISGSELIFDQLLKGMLIAWFHLDPDWKRFYRWRISDYPLNNQAINDIRNLDPRCKCSYINYDSHVTAPCSATHLACCLSLPRVRASRNTSMILLMEPHL